MLAEHSKLNALQLVDPCTGLVAKFRTWREIEIPKFRKVFIRGPINIRAQDFDINRNTLGNSDSTIDIGRGSNVLTNIGQMQL